MAQSDKNIVITPNIGSTTANPKIVFSGADASTAAQNITLQVYPTNSGTLSFDGSAGQLFSITNSLSGTIYSVNDVSGIPSIEVLDTGLIKLGQYGGNVLLGTGTDGGYKLTVNGTARIGNLLVGEGTYKNSITPIDDNNMNLNTPNGYTASGTSLRAPIFYDQNDTGYYGDFASTSWMNVVKANYFSGRDSNGYGIYKGYDNNNHFISIRGVIGGNTTTPTFTGGHQTTFVEYAEAGDSTGWFFKTSATGNYDLVSRITRSYSYFEESIRSPLFYNYSDTGYYCDPNSTSRLHTLTLGDGVQTNIYLTDDDSTGGAKRIHANSNLVGYLNGAGNWLNYTNNSGQIWTAAYGWLHDYFALSGHSHGGYLTGNQTITLSGDASGSGTTSISVTVDQIDNWGFRNTGSNSAVNANDINSNGISYYTNGVDNFSGNSTDGALYSQYYSTDWQHQIAGDFREGNIAVRGKNNNTWSRWKPIPTITISDTAPGNETRGDLWWESDTGKLKIWYADGTSEQWVDAMPIPDTSTFFSKAGGAITGPVVINSSLTTSGTLFGQYIKGTAFYYGSLGYWKSRDNAGSQFVVEYSTSPVLADANIKFTLDTSGNLTIPGYISAASASFSDSVGWGTGSSVANNGNPRSLRIGYSGGNYGGASYGISYTTTSSQHTYAISDLVSRWEAQDGIIVYGAPAGGIGETVSWTTVLDARRTNTSLLFKSNTVLDSSNYTSYAPSLTGSGASGTWNIKIAGYAATPDNSHAGTGMWPVYNWGGVNNGGGATAPAANHYSTGIDVGSHPGDQAYGFQIINPMWHNELWFRSYASGYYGWCRMLHNGNYNSYAPSLTGSGASGSWSINVTGSSGSCSGNAATATRANGNFYIDSNYGRGIVGVYSSTRYQGVYAMGDAYKLADDGSTVGSLYGMAWSHPNTGGIAGNLSSHGLILMQNGGFMCAFSTNIVAAGNVVAQSDERLKTNWRPLQDDYVTKLAQVKVGIYDRVDHPDITQVGVSAQSLQKLLPEAIITAKDEIQTLSVNYGSAAMASSIELAKEVVNLRARIASLEALISKLIKE